VGCDRHGGRGGGSSWHDGAGGGGASSIEIGGETVVLAGGGGGGGGFGGVAAGGGGGSSYRSARLQGSSVVRGGTSDDDGLIAVTWNDVSTPVCTGQDVDVPTDSPGVAVRLQRTELSRPTSFRIDTPPGHGHLQNENLTAGTFNYVPNRGYIGTDLLMFQGRTGDLTSAAETVRFIIRLPTPMHLTASSRQVALGHPPVLTVTLPIDVTGDVAFYADSGGTLTDLGTAPITEGVATLTPPAEKMGVGTHEVHASYGGMGRYARGDSNVVAITVTP
jgi:hypothetical protein